MSIYVDFSKHLFRCSSLGYIMTDPQGDTNMDKYLKCKAAAEKLKSEYDAMEKLDKKGNTMKSAENKLAAYNKKLAELKDLEKVKDIEELSETCKTHLVDVMIAARTGRQTEISNKFIEKGLMVEEDSITLYSRMKRKFFIKNEEHLSNEFIKGTPDIFEGEAIRKAASITDIKSSWDIYTFYRNLAKNINKMYYWQGQGYMELTGAKKFILAYCLVNTPDVFLQEEKRKLFYKMGVATTENEIYLEACEALELSMIYDDIPLDERLIEFEFERNDADIAKLYKRVESCRAYLFELQDRVRKGKPIPELITA